MKAIITHRSQLTHNVITLEFETEQPLRYSAGQFVEITLPHDSPDDRGVRRWFTLSSAPEEQKLAITTKLSSQHSSFKQALQQLQPGDTFGCSEAMGDFVLPKDKSIPLLFIAGGMGITPMRSMLAHLNLVHEKRTCTLIYATATAEDQLFLDTFREAGCTLHQILSTSNDKTRHPLSAKRILELVPDALSKRIYIAGPEQMVETIEVDFTKQGASQADILTDFFPGYAATDDTLGSK